MGVLAGIGIAGVVVLRTRLVGDFGKSRIVAVERFSFRRIVTMAVWPVGVVGRAVICVMAMICAAPVLAVTGGEQGQCD